MPALDTTYNTRSPERVEQHKDVPFREAFPGDTQSGQRFTDNNRETQKRDNGRLESTGVLPNTRIADGGAEQQVLSNPHASAQEKLKTIESLAKQGVNSVKVTDADGTVRDCRIEAEKSGSKTLVHMYAQGSDGKEHVVLRGVSNGDGTYSQESGKNGQKVDFVGSWWAAHSEKSSLGVTAERPSRDSSAQTNDYSVPYVNRDNYAFPGAKQSERRDTTAPSNDYSVPYAGRDFAYPGTTTDRTPQPRTTDDLPTPRRDTERPGQYLDFGPSPYPNDRTSNLNSHFDVYSSMAGRNGKQLQQMPDGSVYFNTGMAIDADGAPDAKRIDRTGSKNTSLRYQDGSSVNAREVPYFVLPAGKYQQFGVKPGDIAAVRYNGKVEFAVFADVGPSHKLGEGSMALASSLGINNNPRNGGVQSGVEYIVFPRSGNGTPLNPELARARGADLLQSRASAIASAYRRRNDAWS